ncbi:hypothetical protein BDZ89DRAFT_1150428 [Hymenopellis radicata]|nr:hypothetical protein BDZ89DRAFT_1150428 [Hymenopellis radicata]
MKPKSSKLPGPPPWVFGTKKEFFESQREHFEASRKNKAKIFGRHMTVCYWIAFLHAQQGRRNGLGEQEQHGTRQAFPEERQDKKAEEAKFVLKVLTWFRKQNTAVSKMETKSILHSISAPVPKTRRQQVVETFTRVYWEQSWTPADAQRTLKALVSEVVAAAEVAHNEDHAAAVKEAEKAGKEPPSKPEFETAKVKLTALRTVSATEYKNATPDVKEHIQHLNAEEYEKAEKEKADVKDSNSVGESRSYADCLTNGVTVLEKIAQTFAKKYDVVLTILIAGRLEEKGGAVTAREFTAEKLLFRRRTGRPLILGICNGLAMSGEFRREMPW